MLDFIEQSHETGRHVCVKSTLVNMIFLFVKYLYFADAEEKHEDISFTDNFKAVPYFHSTVIILSWAPGNPALSSQACHPHPAVDPDARLVPFTILPAPAPTSLTPSLPMPSANPWTYARMHHSRSECLVRDPCLNFYRANRCTIDFVRLLSRGYLAVIHLWRYSYYYPGGSECIVEISFEVLFDKLETNISAFIILLSVDMEAKQVKTRKSPKF